MRTILLALSILCGACAAEPPPPATDTLNGQCWGMRPLCGPGMHPVCICDQFRINCTWVCSG